MPAQAMFTIERVGQRVEIRLVPIPDGPGDDDHEAFSGISFSRREALDFARRIIRVALARH